MKRREAKFVHASPRLSPDQIGTAPRVHETRPRPAGKGARRGKTAPVSRKGSARRAARS